MYTKIKYIIPAVGNITKSAEFNSRLDPEAAKILFQNTEKLVTVTPWEPILESTIPLVSKILYKGNI